MAPVAQFGIKQPGVSYRTRAAAYVVVPGRDTEVALVRGKHGLFLPGGGSHPGETSEENIVREVLEECGRRVEIECQLGEAVQFFEAESMHFEMHASFTMGRFTSTVLQAPEHVLIWASPADARYQLFHECHAWAIQQAEARCGSS